MNIVRAELRRISYIGSLDNRTIRRIAIGLLCVIIIVSTQSFNNMILGISMEEAVTQAGDVRAQVVALILWAVLTGLSFVPGVSRSAPCGRGLLWPLLLITWVAVSPAWSSDPEAGAPKAVVFFATSLVAWRMASVVTTEEMFSCVFHSFGILLLVSLYLVLFMFPVGLHYDWQHSGLWRGVFEDKQALGEVAAVFLVIALLRLSTHRSLLNIASCALGLACLLGSGSRGAGIIAVAGGTCIVVARGRPKMATLMTTVLLFSVMVGVLEIVYFAVTGRASILAFGYDIDLTERTYIWQFVTKPWRDRPWCGFGLNGFWTNADFSYAFLALHGWVLDNYHSGYFAMAIETGIIGLAMFCVLTSQIVVKLVFLLRKVTTNRLSLEMTLGFFIMYFTINLSETFFLRSTNFMAVLFAFLVTKILASPVQVAQMAGLKR